MMDTVGSAKLVFAAWTIGRLLSICGAVAYAELGAMKPQAGGGNTSIFATFMGPLGGFLYWILFKLLLAELGLPRSGF